MAGSRRGRWPGVEEPALTPPAPRPPDAVEALGEQRQPAARGVHRRPEHRRLQPAPGARSAPRFDAPPSGARRRCRRCGSLTLQVAGPALDRDGSPPHHPEDRLLAHPGVGAVVGGHVLEVAGQGVEPQPAVLVSVPQPDRPAGARRRGLRGPGRGWWNGAPLPVRRRSRGQPSGSARATRSRGYP
jgi:hypothetical protein